MEKQKSHEKRKIDSSSSDTVLQSKRNKLRDDQYNDDAISSINNDVFEEIMLRLPVKALIRFQNVSKHWNRTIKSKSFMDRHMLQEKTLEPKILRLNDENSCDGDNITTLTTFRLDWSCSTTCLVKEGPVRIIINPQSKNRNRGYSSCDGLVCFFYGDILKTPIIMTNPATGQSQTLPLSMIQQQYLDKNMQHAKVVEPVPGFGKDSVTGAYKIVWLHNNPKNKILSCEVFDFEVKKWRYVTMDMPYAIIRQKRPTFANGWIYWLTKNKKILAYNLHTEIFRVITHKVLSQASWLRFITMCSLNDCLWITDMKGDKNGIQDFWMIKNVSEELEWEWEKMFSIDSTLISPWLPKEGSSFSCLTLMAISKDNKKVLVSKAYCFSKVIQLLIHPTFLVFLSVVSGPSHRDFIPYYQSLDFPL